jgi:peptidoglycan/LPS O-acetylase OafA/YrhL
MPEGFRNDIEGLRALAIIPILLFHLQPAWCPGGFIGVDIFFVISGYLITRMILDRGPAFRFKDFYLRRFFRLFPALLVTLVVTLGAAWRVLGPADFSMLARSTLAAMFGVSNFYFLAAVDYFNAESLSHPLLHTWSLGVEEQFYLLWPALLVLTNRFRWQLIAAAAVLSLGIQFLVQPDYAKHAFYMMPFRIFEFAAGAGVIAAQSHGPPLGRHVRNVMGTAALVILVTSLYWLDDRVMWPSAWTLAPVLATCLFIQAGSHGAWNRLLGQPVLRFIGRISYALYLVHWPLITLYRARIVIEPSLLELAGLAVGSVLLATALHVLVEIPCNLPKLRERVWLDRFLLPRPVRGPAVGVAALALLAASIAVHASGGFPSRLDRTRQQFLDKGLTFAGDLCDNSSSRCVFGDRAASDKVYLMGDSTALNLVYGLDRLFRDNAIKGIALFDHGCLFVYETKRFQNGAADKPCERNIADAYAYLATNRAPVILAGDYAGYRNEIGPTSATAPLRHDERSYYSWLKPHLHASLEKLNAADRTIIIVKQTYSTVIDLAKCLSQPGSSDAACVPATRTQTLQTYQAADQLIDEVASAFSGTVLIDPKQLFCKTDICTTRGPDGLFFRDTAHLTNAGSDYLVGEAKTVLMEHLRRK